MPTGYTAPLLEEKEMLFEDFVWNCARAFGAFIMQRDDAMNAKPILIEEQSTYHKDAFAKAKADLEEWQEKSYDEKVKLFKEKNKKNRESYKKNLKEIKIKKAKLESMLKKVIDWNPPTIDHIKLKNFMVDQIMTTIDHDCHLFPRPKINPDYNELIKSHEKSLMWNYSYHEKEILIEEERISERNNWKKALFDSVGAPSLGFKGDD